MPSRPFSRFSGRSGYLVGATILLVGVAAVVVALDWWICLPQGKADTSSDVPAPDRRGWTSLFGPINRPDLQGETYVGRQVCAECHPDETRAWTGSDHDMAMDYATSETVLGDFNDAHFAHIALDDVVKLDEQEIKTAVQSIEPGVLAMALQDADRTLSERILGPVSEVIRSEVLRLLDERTELGPVRPCDVAIAQRKVGDVLRRLQDDGRIKADFAITSKMFRRGDDFFVTTDNRDGRMETFQVKYVFGVRPLQQYLVEFPDGRVQCLPVTWDTENERWYHLYPKEPIPSHDPLHWTRPLQNWNYMCAECHSTNLQKNYDLGQNRYDTTWSEIDVSCETCHGPGGLHVQLAKSRSIFWDRRHGYGLPNLKDDNSRVEIETCAPCHSRRRIVHPDFTEGGKFLDAYLPEILDGNLYYADGQILEEDYVYGSFIQSRMYDENVRCTNCHDPHTAKVKFNDNRLCGQSGCHTPAEFDTPSHHHHPDKSKPGTMCVECHMPETTYMVVDPRRDHSLRVPRPDLTVALGIPNACNGCHQGTREDGARETPQWAEKRVDAWYGPRSDRKEPPHFAHGFAAGRELKPEGEDLLAATARRKDIRAAIRASAVSLLSHYQSGKAEAAALAALEDPDELVRAAGVRSLEYLPPEQLHRRLAPSLNDPVRAVRTEAARLLTRVPRRMFSEEDRTAFDAALAEYMAAQRYVGDQAAAHLNMAVIYGNLAEEEIGLAGQLYQQNASRNPAGAEAAQAAYYRAMRKATEKSFREYQQALSIDPLFVPARINLAMLYDQRGQKEEAESQFHEILKIEPDLAEIHYSLGLLIAENEDRLDEAVASLETATRLAPENPRIHYNLAVALQKLGRFDDAQREYKRACSLSPGTIDFVNALAMFYSQRNQWREAIACAEQLIRIEPGNPQWRQLRAYLVEQSRASGEGP